MISTDSQSLTIAANQGEFGGGEVMLLAIGQAARELGYSVTVVAPISPSEVLDEARNQGFDVVAIPSSSTNEYLRNLRRWDRRERQGLLWCNGLRPAVATINHGARVVHLHKEPSTKQKPFARMAQAGALATVVPSQFMARRIFGATPLLNWTLPVQERVSQRPVESDAPMTIGYLGRLSKDKGVDVLCDAVAELIATGHNIRLVIAGESRFVGEAESREIHGRIQRLGPNATHLGWMDRDAFFSAIDLAVFPSTWGEPFGLVAAEAMAARCPFVISDAGALPEIVGAEFPYIAPAGDSHALAEIIKKAFQENDNRVIEQSFARWRTLFSPEAGITRLAGELEKYTGRKPIV